MDASATPAVHPRLVVDDPVAAIACYIEAFAARETSRLTMPDGTVVHAELHIGDSMLSVTQADTASHNPAPATLGGSPVILSIDVDDPDTVAAAVMAAGGSEVFPIEDRFYGRREGRVVDPFGHVWIIGRQIEDLTDTEIQQRLDDAS